MSDLIFTEQAAGTTPSAGKRAVFVKPDGKLYIKDSAGVEAAFPASSEKDASGGYAGLTLFKINFKNALNTVTSFFANAATAARTYTFPDKDITVAGIVDLTATNTVNTPAGNIAAVTVQAAINELDAEKAKLNGDGAQAFSMASLNGGQLAGLRNRIINGNFQINQRVVAGAVVLAAGAYGHDRFKAGAAGCSYTFATVGIVTTLTISAGSLVQAIEGLNVERTDFVMGWTGTAQGRILAGVYAASPVALTAVAGSNLSVEFGIGTLSKVQVEPGATVTPFEFRPIGVELALCQRYFYKTYPQTTAMGSVGNVGALFGAVQGACNYFCLPCSFPVTMRAVPTVTNYATIAGGATGQMTFDGVNKAASPVSVGETGVTIRVNNLASTVDQFATVHVTASAEL